MIRITVRSHGKFHVQRIAQILLRNNQGHNMYQARDLTPLFKSQRLHITQCQQRKIGIGIVIHTFAHSVTCGYRECKGKYTRKNFFLHNKIFCPVGYLSFCQNLFASATLYVFVEAIIDTDSVWAKVI